MLSSHTCLAVSVGTVQFVQYSGSVSIFFVKSSSANACPGEWENHTMPESYEMGMVGRAHAALK